MKIGLSIGIITLNTQSSLVNTLNSVCLIKDIIVVDNGSNDATAEIANSFGAHVYTNTVKDQRALREYALLKCSTEWMFFIDADEIIDRNSLNSILRDLKKNSEIYDGFWIPRRNYYGKHESDYLKHGLFYPDYQLRLIRKNTKYTNTPHEEPDINYNRTRKIEKAYISHYPNKQKLLSIFGFIHLFHFTRSYAKHLKDKSFLYLFSTALIRFLDLSLVSLIRGKGILDGWRGILAAWNFGIHISSIYLYAIYLKTLRRKRYVI